MSCRPTQQRPQRPRPRFWIATDSGEGSMSSPPPCSPAPLYLRSLVAAHSIPLDDEPVSSDDNNRSRHPRRPRRGKLLAEVYDPGFIEERKHTPLDRPYSWTTYYHSYSNAISVTDSRRATCRRLLQVVALIMCAAYAAYQLSCIPRDSYYYPRFDSLHIDSWIRSEEHTAIRALLKNIRPAVASGHSDHYTHGGQRPDA